MGGCDTSWLCFRAPLPSAPPHWPFKRHNFSTNKLSCCTNNPSDAATPKLTRHWLKADSPSPADSQGDRNASKHRYLYLNVPSHYMKWERRKRVICEELIGWDPDIICLQEVDKYYDLLSILEKEGYAGTYKRRTGESVDGCAMFWKANKFRLLVGDSIEFKRFSLRDNVAQLSVFEVFKGNSRRLLIGNIHVLYNPSRGDIKLGQIHLLSSRAHALSQKWGNVPTVLAGDFNSTPQSAIYKFLSSSKLNIMSYDRRDLSGQRSCHPAQVVGIERKVSRPFTSMDRFSKYCWSDEEVKTATGNSEHTIVEHPLKLNSTYAAVKGSTRTRGSNGEPLATTYHSDFLGTVDYVWYSDGLVPTRVVDTPPIDTLCSIGGLPCKKVGSDHLALVAEFALTQVKKDETHIRATTTTTTITAISKPATAADGNSLV